MKVYSIAVVRERLCGPILLVPTIGLSKVDGVTVSRALAKSIPLSHTALPSPIHRERKRPNSRMEYQSEIPQTESQAIMPMPERVMPRRESLYPLSPDLSEEMTVRIRYDLAERRVPRAKVRKAPPN